MISLWSLSTVLYPCTIRVKLSTHTHIYMKIIQEYNYTVSILNFAYHLKSKSNAWHESAWKRPAGIHQTNPTAGNGGTVLHRKAVCFALLWVWVMSYLTSEYFQGMNSKSRHNVLHNYQLRVSKGNSIYRAGKLGFSPVKKLAEWQ